MSKKHAQGNTTEQEPAAAAVADVSATGDTPRTEEPTEPETPADAIAASLANRTIPNRFLTHFPLDGVHFDFIEKPVAGQPYGEGKQLNTVPVHMAQVFIAMGDTEAAIPCTMVLQQGADKEGRAKVLSKKVGQRVTMLGINPEYDDASGNKNRLFKLQWPSKGKPPYVTPFVKVAKGSLAAAEMDAFSKMVVKRFVAELKERNISGKQNPIDWDIKTAILAEGAASVGISEDEAADLGID